MTRLRLASVIAVAVVGGLLGTSAPAQAFAVFPFRADSGDNCRYGSTQGSLIWRYSSSAPIRAVAVDVRGTLVDHPLPNEVYQCRDDGYYSVATFVGYLSDGIVRKEARANNEVVSLAFTLGSNSVIASISRLVVQVCRSPRFGTGPSYCGVPQHYGPIVYDPPPPRP